MKTKVYQDFDLSLEKAGDRYRARLLYSPDGSANSEFDLPFSDIELDNFILRFGQARRTTRNMGATSETANRSLREFGTRLYEAIFNGQISDRLHSSLAITGQKENTGLRIRLRLSDAPELIDIPWEYLFDASRARFLTLSIETPLVRYLDLPGQVNPLAVQPPLHILVMISSPNGYPPLDVEQEWEKLKDAVTSLESRGLIILERMKKPTLVELQHHLRKQNIHIFHFIGHGSFDQSLQDGVLILETEDGRSRPTSGKDLGMLLHDEKSIQLAVLNACEGGRTSRQDPFAGVGQSLVQQGIPAVVAMQFEISDQAAIAFSHEFYAALADNYPVDAALTEARKAIFALDSIAEWGTPVLYMRSQDGHVFDVTRRSEVVQPTGHEPKPIPFPSSLSTWISENWLFLTGLVGGLLFAAMIFWLQSHPRLFFIESNLVSTEDLTKILTQVAISLLAGAILLLLLEIILLPPLVSRHRKFSAKNDFAKAKASSIRTILSRPIELIRCLFVALIPQRLPLSTQHRVTIITIGIVFFGLISYTTSTIRNNCVADLVEARWYQLDAPFAENLTRLAVNPLDSSIVLAGTLNGEVFQSIDGGVTWEETAFNLAPEQSAIGIIVFDPVNSSAVYIGTPGAGLWKSVDYGNHWGKLTFGLQGQDIRSLLIDPEEHNVIYAGTWGYGIFKSIDAGSTWTPMSDGLSDLTIMALAIAPGNDGGSRKMYAGSSGNGVFILNETKNTWRQTSLDHGNVDSIIVDPRDTNTLYAGLWEDGIQLSTDGGATWKSSNAGLPDLFIRSKLTMDVLDSKTLYVGTWSSGVYASKNSGENWFLINSDLSVVRSIAAIPLDPSSLLVASRSGLFRVKKGEINLLKCIKKPKGQL